MGLKDARERREQAKKLLAQGIDPSAHKQEAKAAATAIEQEQATTFEAVAREWFSKKKAAWKPVHQEKILSRLEKQIFPFIGAGHSLHWSLPTSSLRYRMRNQEGP